MIIDPHTELRVGDYREVLSDVECDALIVDAPYSARTHGGHDGAPTVGTHALHRSGEGSQAHATGYRGTWPPKRRAISYSGWLPADVAAFCAFWSPRTAGWIVTITDHTLAPVWSKHLAEGGRYVFAPLPWYAPGSRVRLSGDGPSSWTCWIVVARPRHAPYTKWGTLPGGYVFTTGYGKSRADKLVGGKPLWLMRALVRDYTRPGDLVCDPCAGGGTTLRAAQLEARRAIGSELDPATHAKAVARLRAPYTRPLFTDAPKVVQPPLFGED